MPLESFIDGVAKGEVTAEAAVVEGGMLGRCDRELTVSDPPESLLAEAINQGAVKVDDAFDWDAALAECQALLAGGKFKRALEASPPWWERERAFNPVHVKHGEHGGEFATKEGEPGAHEHEVDPKKAAAKSAAEMEKLLEFAGTPSDEERIAAKRKIMEDLGRRIEADESVTLKQLQEFNAADGFNRATPPGLANATKDDRAYQSRIAANSLVALWTQTSGDHSEPAIAVQLVAQQVFGLGDAATDHFAPFQDPTSPRRMEIAKEMGAQHRAVIESALRGMYANTQERLKDAPDHVWFYRGVGNDVSDQTAVKLQPLSSFTTRLGTARDFALLQGGSRDWVFAVRVPKRLILGTARTGYGSLIEDEFVLLGGEQRVVHVPREEGER